MKIKIKIDHIDVIQIDLVLGIDTNIVNIKIVSVRWCLYVLSIT